MRLTITFEMRKIRRPTKYSQARIVIRSTPLAQISTSISRFSPPGPSTYLPGSILESTKIPFHDVRRWSSRMRSAVTDPASHDLIVTMEALGWHHASNQGTGACSWTMTSKSSCLLSTSISCTKSRRNPKSKKRLYNRKKCTYEEPFSTSVCRSI
ncbi:hypothetical protein SISNIDRAFT_107198 [Sistotremastrum niveocremeum HHB9708]|uniref:Uncharacterized protein n=2 Tax=Sistotremastraceae TaxID=3402574 RepID=A0A164TXZ8_9AGAM|nr:hypothetical protein SISNIDRAFT_107198 [Sistotremastrum niveocremeum HHB9708]KZT35771.1 hypothetical protein SISSUDRAFT_130076 [Sistotremastrum suecicum HHB10207 ss-3]